MIVLSFFSCTKEKKEKITIQGVRKEGNLKYNFYKKNGKLNKTLEFINLCGKKYLNQGWYFNNSSDTIYEKSNFYKIIVEKNILKTNETSKITIYYNPLLKNTVSGLLISNQNVDLDYCNLNAAKLDTIYFVDNKLQFYQSFKNKGKVRIGGYILEISKILKNNDNRNEYDERKVYLNITFEVK